MHSVIMLASGKGGTGKSTVSVAIGGALCSMGKTTLLIELDGGLRSIDIISGVSGQTVYDIADVISGTCPIEKAVVKSVEHHNLNLISAPYNNGHITKEGLLNLIQHIGRYYDYILIDTAAGLGEPFCAAAAVSDTAIIVVTPDPVAVRDGYIVAGELENNGISNIRLLLNKVFLPWQGKNPVEDLDDCIDEVGAQLIGVVPNSKELYVSSTTGKALGNTLEREIFLRIAKRLCGLYEPLIFEIN